MLLALSPPRWSHAAGGRHCLDEDVVRRVIEYSSSQRIQTAQGFIDIDMSFEVPGVPYCSAHAAEHDAHLARRGKLVHRPPLPEPTPLADGKQARFWTPLGNRKPGGSLGFWPDLQVHVVNSDTKHTAPGDLHLHFQSAEFAALFRAANHLRTIGDQIAHDKQERRDRRQAAGGGLRGLLDRSPLRMEKLRKAGDVPGLVAALSHEQPLTRANALSQLAWLRDDPRTGDFLGHAIALMRDPEVLVRDRAVGVAILVSGAPLTPTWAPPSDRRLVAALVDAMRDPAGPVREAARREMAKIPCRESVEALQALLDDPDPEVRASVPDVLAKLCGYTFVGSREDVRQQATNVLVAATQHDDVAVRQAANQALADMPAAHG